MAPDEAWQILAEAERRDPVALTDILLYPTVGVWLTRALHYTRPGRTAAWPELGYFQQLVAAAAIRCGHPCTVRVPVWHGIVSLPTVGYVRIPGTFPIGAVDVISTETGARVQVDPARTIPLDGTNPAFRPATLLETTSRGLTLRAWLEDTDPYHGFGERRPPTELTDTEFGEWHKLLDEAWDVLTLNHPGHAVELIAGLRSLSPIEPDLDIVGASSPAAFGGIRLSANGSAADFAEALVHEIQHSKLNALLGLTKLTDDDDSRRFLAPWRDDPRPLVGVVHGVYAFTCGVEFWSAQNETAQDSEARRIAFDIAFRRVQVQRALATLKSSGQLTRPGEALVDAVSKRLSACPRPPVGATTEQAVLAIVDDHRALWRLRYGRPDPATVNAFTMAWLDGTPPPAIRSYRCPITTEGDHHRLPSNRRALLRAKATDPESFAALVRRASSLPGTTPRGDAALCTGDYLGAAAAYEDRLRTSPGDLQAWAGLGLALQAQGREAAGLLERPELAVAVHRRIRTLCGTAPDPTTLSAWLDQAL